MPQLSKDAAEHFLHLHRHLMLFTNERYRIETSIKTRTDLVQLQNPAVQRAIVSILQKMYATENIDLFCTENPYHFSEADLEKVRAWQYGLSGSAYIMRHLKAYSVFMVQHDHDDQLYGVVGVSDDIETLVPNEYLPMMVKVTLLPYGDQIIYDGILQHHNVMFGGGAKKNLRDDYNQAKALQGIYATYTAGDDLRHPPATTTLKDQIEYSIKQSRAREEFPQRALELADAEGQRAVFEHCYAKRPVRNAKSWIKYNDELPPMYYAMYRQCVVAVMPKRKEVLSFCEEHYHELVDYITIFKG